jgi:CheY-like chemotaxis protein
MRLEGLVEMTQCLLVDADGVERSELSRLFGGYGFQLAESADAATALRHCQTHSPDVVVMTDRIGGMSSGDFVKRVRKNARGKPPIVLLYTDQPDTERIGQVILEGAAECLMKPLDRDLLEFKLKQVGLL